MTAIAYWLVASDLKGKTHEQVDIYIYMIHNYYSSYGGYLYLYIDNITVVDRAPTWKIITPCQGLLRHGGAPTQL